MKSSIFTGLLALFCTVVLAAPEANPAKSKVDPKRHGCLSDGDAKTIVQRWISLFEGKTDQLDRAVTKGVTLEDEQVNFLFNLPPGPYAVGKEAFRGVLDFNKSQVGSKDLNIEALLILHDCDTISFRWQAKSVATGLDRNATAKAGDLITYKGIDILEVEKGTKLIKKAITSADYLFLLYLSGTKICFQKDAPNPVCSS